MKASELEEYFERHEDIEVCDAADIQAAAHLIGLLAQSIGMAAREPSKNRANKCDGCGQVALMVNREYRFAHCFGCGQHRAATDEEIRERAT